MLVFVTSPKFLVMQYPTANAAITIEKFINNLRNKWISFIKSIHKFLFSFINLSPTHDW